MNLSDSYRDNLAASVAAVELKPADAAVVRAAYGYADELDAGGDVAKVGPPFLACLTALGLTPAARAALAGKGATTDEQRANPLDELRQRRAAREA